MSSLAEFEQRKRDTAGVFSRAAATYDQVGPRFFGQFGKQLVAFAQLRAGWRVLDVAAGRGAVLFPAAEAVGAEGRVVGIDLAENMLRETTRTIAERGVANAKMRLMDAEQLQFADASFDAVLCGFALFMFPQVTRALAGFRRVLKPRGRLAVTTWELSHDWDWYDDILKRYLPAPASPSNTPQPAFDTPAGMMDLLSAAGFSDIEVVAEHADSVYRSTDEWWATAWSHGARRPLERLEQMGKLNDFKCEVFDEFERRRQADGFHSQLSVLCTRALKP